MMNRRMADLGSMLLLAVGIVFLLAFLAAPSLIIFLWIGMAGWVGIAVDVAVTIAMLTFVVYLALLFD
jgi:hypothetical protein